MQEVILKPSWCSSGASSLKVSLVCTGWRNVGSTNHLEVTKEPAWH